MNKKGGEGHIFKMLLGHQFQIAITLGIPFNKAPKPGMLLGLVLPAGGKE